MTAEPVKTEAVRRILVRVPNWIGDAVMATPALMALRAAYGSAEITVLGRPSIVELLRHHPGLDTSLVDDHRARHRGVVGRMALVREMRARRFDLAVLLPNSFESVFWAWLAGIPRRIGYATDGRGFLLTESIPVPGKKGSVHQVQYYQRLVERLTGEPPRGVPKLVIPVEEDDRIQKQFPELAFKEDFMIGINPGAVFGTAKRWPPERFAELTDRLIDLIQRDLGSSKRVQSVVVGGPGEEGLGRVIVDMMKHRATVLSGRTTLRELMVIIKHCSLFVTNDTGPMHIAQALEVPLVGIFGPTDPKDTAPYHRPHSIVRSPVRCSPCFLRHCPIDHRCMSRVTVDQVVQAALQEAGVGRMPEAAVGKSF